MANRLVVTPDNFNRAESDMYFAGDVKRGGFGRFAHHRELMPIDRQTVIRPNRDTLYSSAVFDLDAGPVTITLPDAGPRFMSMQVIDEDQYAYLVTYGPGARTFTKEQIGTRYILVGIRILVDPARPNDLADVHALQDAIASSQAESGRFEVPEWDSASQRRVRDALLTLGTTISETTGMFGPRNEVDPVRHLIGSAIGWGGNPARDALYLTVTPAKNDGRMVHRLTVKDVPVDGFWSVSVYNAKGFFEPNPQGIYTLNNLTARKDAFGAVTIQFGGCDGQTPNCIPITPGWNYTVRLYRPRPEVLSGRWTFPTAQPVVPVGVI